MPFIYEVSWVPSATATTTHTKRWKLFLSWLIFWKVNYQYYDDEKMSGSIQAIRSAERKDSRHCWWVCLEGPSLALLFGLLSSLLFVMSQSFGIAFGLWSCDAEGRLWCCSNQRYSQVARNLRESGVTSMVLGKWSFTWLHSLFPSLRRWGLITEFSD